MEVVVERTDGGEYGSMEEALSACRQVLAEMAVAWIWRKLDEGVVVLDGRTYRLAEEVKGDGAAAGGAGAVGADSGGVGVAV